MYCECCGIKVNKNSKNCPGCGESLVASPTSIINSKGTTTSLETSFVNQFLSTGSPALSAGSLSGNIKLNKPNENLLNNLIANEMISEKGAFTKETTPPTEVLTKDMLCRRCHSELRPGGKFCSVCGSTSDPSKAEQLLSYLQLHSKNSVKKIATNITQINLPTITLGCLIVGGFSFLAAIFQYLIPTSVDDKSIAPLIYHLRGIQFLLMALIFVVAGLIFNRR